MKIQRRNEMTAITTTAGEPRDIPRTLIHALFRHPQELQVVLHEAGLAPYELAMWARQMGDAQEIEKLAGWLAVGRRLGHYKPLLEVAASHLRAGDLMEALPVFRWAYQAWRTVPHASPKHSYDGVKLLALWGQCLYHLDYPEGAARRWLRALELVHDAETLGRLSQIIERAGAGLEYRALLEEAVRRDLPGSRALWSRWERISLADRKTPEDTPALPAATMQGPGLAIMADVANLDMVCGEQYGFGSRLDYERLLRLAEAYGPARVKLAFVPDIPETLDVRRHLQEATFDIHLQRPKRAHGRMVANADTAMASFAVRWASDPGIQRLELWTGDGDFLRVREAVGQAWPEVQVIFRSFEIGTAAGIRELEDAWQPITAAYLL
jgi:hypothetical protein